MNVLLIHPNCGFQALPQSAPLGLMSIATYLKQRGCNVRVYDRNVETCSIDKIARAFMPDAVGVAMISMTHITDSVAVSRRFQNDGIPVIWGGHMASIVPEMILRENAADYVVIGEGEITFYELLQAIEDKSDITQIRGIAYQGSTGAICRTPRREFANLANMPVIDWSFVDPKKYFAPRMGCKKMMYLYSSKGCPGRCAFCFNEGYHYRKCRKRPNEYVVSEIEELATKHGLDGVNFADEMFGLNKRELYDLCSRLRNLGLGITWGCQTRLGHMSREDLQLMYDCGCRWIYFGIESGSPEMQKRIRKEIDLEAIEKEIHCCRKIGISSHCGIIIGLPDETEQQLRESVQLLLRLDPNLVLVTMFGPIPGTEFSNYLVSRGRLTLPKTLREWERVRPQEDLVDNFSEVPTRDLRVVQCYFYWRSFTHKNFPSGAKRYEFAFNTATASLRHIFRQRYFHVFLYILSSSKLFLTIAWYANAYPGVRKKYGLYARKDIASSDFG